ncbi:hypothetical protein [Intestinibacter sp.]
MADIDQRLINETLRKINESLNKRFEKDAELYISRQDEYELKKHICNNNFDAVVDMIKGKDINPEIVIKVFTRNAGIIEIKNINIFESKMKSVLKSVNYESISYMMEDILNNNVYIQKELRLLLFKYYINGISQSKRMEYWLRENNILYNEERKELFDTILLKNYKEKSLKQKIDFCNSSFETYKFILEDKRIFVNLKNTLNESEKDEFFKYLSNGIKSPSISDDLYKHIIIEAYETYENKAFKDSVIQLKENVTIGYKDYINVVINLILEEKNGASAVNMFDTMNNFYNSSTINRNIKNRMDDKFWRGVKRNESLYKCRQKEIEIHISTPITENGYKTFTNDILNDIKTNKSASTIAYKWRNMINYEGKKAFKISLIDSFSETPILYSDKIYEIYRYLFIHSQRYKGMETLSQICEIMAKAILSCEEMTNVSRLADDLLCSYVLNYKIKGNKVKTYMTMYHFDKLKG